MAETVDKTKEAEKSKTVSIINLSTRNRPFQCAGFPDAKGNQTTIIIPPNSNKSVEVPASSAEFLLGKLSSGAPRFPELKDAATYLPVSANGQKQLDALKAENAQLLQENADLKAKLAKSDTPVGGNKK